MFLDVYVISFLPKDIDFNDKALYIEIDTVNEYKSLDEFSTNDPKKYLEWRRVTEENFPNYNDDDYLNRHSYSYMVSKIAGITLAFYNKEKSKIQYLSITGSEIDIIKEWIQEFKEKENE